MDNIISCPGNPDFYYIVTLDYNGNYTEWRQADQWLQETVKNGEYWTNYDRQPLPFNKIYFVNEVDAVMFFLKFSESDQCTAYVKNDTIV